MNKARKIYEQHYGKVPQGYEVHHIIPKHAGGTDDISNLVALTQSEHKAAHLALYEKYGRKEDLMAAYMFTTSEMRHIKAALGGAVGGKNQLELKVGIHGLPREEQLRQIAIARAIQEERKSNRFVYATKEEQSSRGKRGGPKNKGFVWVNNGTIEVKYTSVQQQEETVADFLLRKPEFKLGRLVNKMPIACPHCGTVGHSPGAMGKHHFNNCKRKRNEN